MGLTVRLETPRQAGTRLACLAGRQPSRTALVLVRVPTSAPRLAARQALAAASHDESGAAAKKKKKKRIRCCQEVLQPTIGFCRQQPFHFCLLMRFTQPFHIRSGKPTAAAFLIDVFPHPWWQNCSLLFSSLQPVRHCSQAIPSITIESAQKNCAGLRS